MRRNLVITNDEERWKSQIKEAAGKGERFAICCRCKTDAMAMHQWLLTLLPEDQISIFTSDTNSDKVKEFEHINRHIATRQAGDFVPGVEAAPRHPNGPWCSDENGDMRCSTMVHSSSGDARCYKPHAHQGTAGLPETLCHHDLQGDGRR
jgi:hypothetical protein